MPNTSNQNLELATQFELATQYLHALGEGAPPEALRRFFHDEIVFEALPNLIRPAGAKADLAAMLAASELGRQTVKEQRFAVHHAIADGDFVALEMEWTGTLAAPFGALPTGKVLRARCGVFMQFRDGRIISQRNYDCYDPF
jgi:steroid delta-isomerase-like uncharacterized protein